MANDITEDLPVDLSKFQETTTFQVTDTAYDLTIDEIPFVMSVNNQNPYRRETAQYRKDQFDNSPEPGEQSLTGWWLRSQTSWHNGAGIKFYEPGTDYQHVSHRFADSRGVDVSTIGEATLLPEVFHAYTGTNGINAAVGNDGTKDCLVSGDSAGVLKKVTLSGDSAATTVNYYNGSTYPEGHNGSNYPFYSVTTDGSNYYAVCSRAIHTGYINTASSDQVAINFSTTDRTDTFIKYCKGYLLFGLGNILHNITISMTSGSRTESTHIHSGGVDSLGSNYKTHLNASWRWTDTAAGPQFVYAAGHGGNKSEIWAIAFDETTNTLDMPGAVVVAEMPSGEIIHAIDYYLGYLSVATSKGLRVCTLANNGTLAVGPLLFESEYAVNALVSDKNYVYAATKVDAEDSYTHGCVVRVDLSQQFDDGTFAYWNDIEYRSSINIDNEEGFTAESSEATEAYILDGRMILVIEEDGTGELQVQHTTRKRNTGWLKTGIIRYNTVEKKFFRYLNTQCTTGTQDSITISTIDANGIENNLATISEGLSNKDIYISNPEDAQEHLSFRFTLNNDTDDTELPVLTGYQVKAVPAVRRQRLHQYPLQCFDIEMDRFNSIFGYSGRAMSVIQTIESLEETGKFVTITDYRTGESYSGVIEEVRFTNESSPDKNNSGFGGLLMVTVRKM